MKSHWKFSRRIVGFAVVTGVALGLPLSANAQDKTKKGEDRGKAVSSDTPALIGKAHKGWKYFEGGKSPGDKWTTADFDDSTWKKGQAPLGYGEKDIKTRISFGADGNSKNVVAFFRCEFVVKDPKVPGKYAAGIRCDDGAIIYLNGKEVHRENVAKGPRGGAGVEKQKAQYAIGPDGPIETNYHFFEIKAEDVKAGKNAISVSVHQSSVRSSDMVLDLEIVPVNQAGLDAIKTKIQRDRLPLPGRVLLPGGQLEQDRDGLAYEVGRATPFTGIEKQDSTVSGKIESNYKDGKLDGARTWRDGNGKKRSERNYKDGRLDGVWTDWHENGQKKSEANYKDGVLQGAGTSLWDKNGLLIEVRPPPMSVPGSGVPIELPSE